MLNNILNFQYCSRKKLNIESYPAKLSTGDDSLNAVYTLYDNKQRRKFMKKFIVAALCLAGGLSYSVTEAVQTNLVIRAKSKDAKFVGTKMGGAVVIVKDSATGKVLAEGLTEGGTGDTGKIMIDPKTRFGTIGDGAAKFETSINIDEPTLVTIDVSAPYVYRDNMIKSSTQMWLIPGKHITGEGIIIEVPGFSVNARSMEKVKLEGGKAFIPVQAQIVMI